MPQVLSINDETIAEAVAALGAGKLVAFPTETVYGLGADATNGQAVGAIFTAKGRPRFNPLIVHLPTLTAVDPLVVWNDTARALAAHFWPGPLTLILPRSSHSNVSLLASAGLSTTAVRVPSHPVAQKLLRAFGRPIAAPSANASGKLSPTTPKHVVDSLGENVDIILAGGRSAIGLESTVIGFFDDAPIILRPGGITHEQLARVLGQSVKPFDPSLSPKPLAPGMLASHYAPTLPLRLNVGFVEIHEALLDFGQTGLYAPVRLNLSVTGDLSEAAANLFSMLRDLDASQCRAIAVAPIPIRGLGVAMNDRLVRAALR